MVGNGGMSSSQPYMCVCVQQIRNPKREVRGKLNFLSSSKISLPLQAVEPPYS